MQGICAGRWPGALLAPALAMAALLVSGTASAVTLTGFKGQGLDAIYGSYAPRGDCGREPRLIIGESGFTFHAGGRTVTSRRFEYAVSFMGPEYQGISSVFFPFPVNDGNMGPVLMIVNDDEKRGVIRIEADLAPGQRLDPFHAALTQGSPFLLCKGTGSAAAAAPPASTAPNPAPVRVAAPLDWKTLPAATGRYPGEIDLFGSGEVASALRALLGAKLSVVERNMNVAGPLKRAGSLYYVSGNALHRGGMDQAYLIMDAARRAVEAGLWENGKLTVYRSSERRLPPPAEIARLLDRSPPETAMAAPGPPWENVPVQGRAPLAYIAAAASPDIESFILFCDKGHPALAMLLNKPARAAASVTVSWVFAGGIVTVPMIRGNRESTFWQGGLTGSQLPGMLIRQSGSVYFRINGEMQGEASLAGSTAAVRTALASCLRL